MPIPNPKKNEDRNKYMGRCMEFMKDEKYKQKQKVAICLNTFSKPKKKANAEIELDITDTEAYQKFIKKLYDKAKSKGAEFVAAIPESIKKEHKLS